MMYRRLSIHYLTILEDECNKQSSNARRKVHQERNAKYRRILRLQKFRYVWRGGSRLVQLRHGGYTILLVPHGSGGDRTRLRRSAETGVLNGGSDLRPELLLAGLCSPEGAEQVLELTLPVTGPKERLDIISIKYIYLN